MATTILHQPAIDYQTTVIPSGANQYFEIEETTGVSAIVYPFVNGTQIGQWEFELDSNSRYSFNAEELVRRYITSENLDLSSYALPVDVIFDVESKQTLQYYFQFAYRNADGTVSAVQQTSRTIECYWADYDLDNEYLFTFDWKSCYPSCPKIYDAAQTYLGGGYFMGTRQNDFPGTVTAKTHFDNVIRENNNVVSWPRMFATIWNQFTTYNIFNEVFYVEASEIVINTFKFGSILPNKILTLALAGGYASHLSNIALDARSWENVGWTTQTLNFGTVLPYPSPIEDDYYTIEIRGDYQVGTLASFTASMYHPIYIKFENDEKECKDRSTYIPIIYKSRNGGWDYIYLNRCHRKEEDTAKEVFVPYRVEGNMARQQSYGRLVYNNTAERRIVCNSGFVNAKERMKIEDMVNSPMIFTYEDVKTFDPQNPNTVFSRRLNLNVNDSSYTFKDTRQDKLVNYEISFSYSSKNIQL